MADSLYNPVPLVTVPTGNFTIFPTSPTTFQLAALENYTNNIPNLPGYKVPETIPPTENLRATYLARAVHFDGQTVIALPTFKSAPSAPFMSFSVWLKSQWQGGQTIFAVDPATHDTPFLKTSPPDIFVMCQAEPYGAAPWPPLAPARIYYSTDGVNWTRAITPIDDYPSLVLNGGGGPGEAIQSQPQFFNGMFMVGFGYDAGIGDTGPPNHQPYLANVYIYSYDGIKWQIAWQPTAGDISNGLYYMGYADDTPWVKNGVSLTNAPFVSPGNVINIFIPCLNPPGPTFFEYMIDTVGSPFLEILVDPNQPADNLPTTGTGNVKGIRPLPPWMSAVRVRADTGGDTVYVDYTPTPITDLIVDSGDDMPLASWSNSFIAPSSGGYLMYGPVTNGSNSTRTQLVWSYCGISRAADVNQPPFVPLQRFGWIHVMGTVNTQLNTALLYIQGQPCGVFNSNFVFFDPNGFELYIGGDGHGNNYVGDMSELFLYPGVDLSSADGTIDSSTMALFVDYAGFPVNPFGFNGAIHNIRALDPTSFFYQLGPSVLLSGDATTFLINEGYSGQDLITISGALTDADSSPSFAVTVL